MTAEVEVTCSIEEVMAVRRELPQLDHLAATFVLLHRKGVKFSPCFVPELRHLQGEWTAWRDLQTKELHVKQKA